MSGNTSRYDRLTDARRARRHKTILDGLLRLTSGEKRRLMGLLRQVSVCDESPLPPSPPLEALRAAREIPIGPWRHGYVKHARDRIRAERAAARRPEEVRL